MAVKKKKQKHTYTVDVDFFSVTYKVRAVSAGDARRQVRAKIKAGVAVGNIRDMLTDKD